jgi:cyclopropane-fatty-acyl-phospholipid synthase
MDDTMSKPLHETEHAASHRSPESGAERRLVRRRRRRPASARDLVGEWLAVADIAIDGSRPWDLRLHDERLWTRMLADGSLGVGEAYMDGWWDCERLDELLTRAMRAAIDARLPSMWEAWLALKSRLVNLQSPRRAFTVGRRHYDVGDDLYARMLDPRMIYSCGYWRAADDLATAQEAKLDLVCRKLGLKPGMRVLDIGCGWGGAAEYAAQHYGVHVTGVTVSENQAVAARERCRALPVEIIFEDYRSLTGRFDRIYSLGMFEHVGARNHRRYLAKARELLEPDGLFLLHTIGNRVTQKANDPWIEKYIFPNSLIPSRLQIDAAAEGLWVVEDWHEFGVDYDRTLLAWSDNVERRWPEIGERYGERFHRMWHYWLMVSAASFRARHCHLWQIVLSAEGLAGGYAAVR